jgi:hypothetical protein
MFNAFCFDGDHVTKLNLSRDKLQLKPFAWRFESMVKIKDVLFRLKQNRDVRAEFDKSQRKCKRHSDVCVYRNDSKRF